LLKKATKTKPKAVTEKGALFFESTFISLGSVQDKEEPIKLVV